MVAKEPSKRAKTGGYDDRAFNADRADYDEQRENDKAIAEYSRAIQLNPDSSFSYLRRAMAYEKGGRLREAIEDYKKSIKAAPKGMQLQRNYARHRIQELKRISEAGGSEDKD